MTTIKALLIPYDESVPVEEFEFDDGKFTTIDDKVLGGNIKGSYLGISTFRNKNTILMYDDTGLLTQPNNTNTRAMKLWAHLAGMNLDNFRQPLVGNYVVSGLTDWGDSADVTSDVRYFFGEEGVRQGD